MLPSNTHQPQVTQDGVSTPPNDMTPVAARAVRPSFARSPSLLPSIPQQRGLSCRDVTYLFCSDPASSFSGSPLWPSSPVQCTLVTEKASPQKEALVENFIGIIGLDHRRDTNMCEISRTLDNLRCRLQKKFLGIDATSPTSPRELDAVVQDFADFLCLSVSQFPDNSHLNEIINSNAMLFNNGEAGNYTRFVEAFLNGPPVLPSQQFDWHVRETAKFVDLLPEFQKILHDRMPKIWNDEFKQLFVETPMEDEWAQELIKKKLYEFPVTDFIQPSTLQNLNSAQILITHNPLAGYLNVEDDDLCALVSDFANCIIDPADSMQKKLRALGEHAPIGIHIAAHIICNPSEQRSMNNSIFPSS